MVIGGPLFPLSWSVRSVLGYDVAAKIMVLLGESGYLSTKGPDLAALNRGQFGHCMILLGDRYEFGECASRSSAQRAAEGALGYSR